MDLVSNYGLLNINRKGIGFCILSSEGIGTWVVPTNSLDKSVTENSLEDGFCGIQVVFELIRNAKWSRPRPTNILRIPDIDYLTPKAAHLTKTISHKKRWRLCELVEQQNLSDGWLKKLLAEVPSIEKKGFWLACPPSVSIASKIFLIAAHKDRIAIIKRSYAQMTEINVSSSHPTICVSAETIIKVLDEKDQQLAKIWARDPSESEFYDKEFTKQLSARAAEKAAAEILRQTGYQVEDIAVQQLTPGSVNWKTHDILLEGNHLVDIKNSRKSINGNTYVEHTIPSKKYRRIGENVYIAGMMSPYLSQDDIEDLSANSLSGPEKKYNRYKKFCFLGLTTRKKIRKLEKEFKSEILRLTILMDRHSSDTISGKVIPPWCYEMPRKFVAPLEEAFNNFNQYPAEQIPSAKLLKEAGLRPPFGLFLAANRHIPVDWMKGLKTWQCEFLNSIQNYKKLTLPRIYLHILQHFADCVLNPPHDYNPEEYVDLIFFENYPAGRLDPLHTIYGLITNLSRVWRRRKSIGLHEFRHFYYRGLGNLRGKRSSGEDYITLIAYCGGIVKGKGKCGFENLVLGGENITVCPSCKRLICPKCGSCDNRCLENDHRQEIWKPLTTEEEEKAFSLKSAPPDIINVWDGDLTVPGEDDLPEF